MGLKKLEEAEEVFKEVTRERPEEVKGWMALGRILEMRGAGGEEIEKIKRVVRELSGRG